MRLQLLSSVYLCLPPTWHPIAQTRANSNTGAGENATVRIVAPNSHPQNISQFPPAEYFAGEKLQHMLPQNEYIVDFGVMGFRNVLMCLTERSAEAHATRDSHRPASTQRMDIEMTKIRTGAVEL